MASSTFCAWSLSKQSPETNGFRFDEKTMNRTKLKIYAPQGRRAFIQAMTDRAAFFGLTAKKIEPVAVKGDVALIVGRPFPKKVAEQRKRLETRIEGHGFEQTMEALAYTWFNRLVAIRFMELHGYLDHGYRVLSHPEGKPTPEILEHAEHVDLPGLKKETVIDLKLAGNKEAELYRLLLTAQCNALHAAMPFLFEKIDDETELLLPDNLLHSDSLIRKLVSEIDEEDWQVVEIIGWLYQFYISEKKDEVIGKVVASDDIPAATQLFTPNWIVKYLVQNTLGRQWLATYPQSGLRQQMEYYIEPAEQTQEVQEQLKAITPTSLNPEEMTLLDPACGSGHILVEAYDLFKAIYQERGYRAKDIPALILQKNLFGLEIDDRAAQLAAFALMMNARADDRRIFDSEAKPNILAFQESQGMNAADLAHALNAPINKENVPQEHLFEEIQEEKDGLFSKKALAEKGHVSQADIACQLELFENAKTFGSLIQIPPKLAAELPEIEKRLEDVLKYGDLTHTATHVLKPLLQQARLLARRYDVVVANPPYMGWKYLNAALRQYLTNHYPDADKDLFSAFMVRSRIYALPSGRLGIVSPFSWMFLPSFSELRNILLSTSTLETLVQLEFNAFEPAMVTVCAYTLCNRHTPSHLSTFIRLSEFTGADNQGPKTIEAIANRECGWLYYARPDNFTAIPASPIAYWVSDRVRNAFIQGQRLDLLASPRKGMCTRDNNAFVRRWQEVSIERTGFHLNNRAEAIESKKRWFPYQKGGEGRNWYGNHEWVVDWENDGYRLRNMEALGYAGNSTNHNLEYIFRPALVWSKISSTQSPSFRYSPGGFLFDDASGLCWVKRHDELYCVLGFLCSKVCYYLLSLLNPTLNIQPGNMAVLPFLRPTHDVTEVVKKIVELSKQEWDSCEQSWDFSRHPWIMNKENVTISASNATYAASATERRKRISDSEAISNNAFVDVYGLANEVGRLSVEKILCLPDEQEEAKRLLSYAIGCMMGRYSLDKAGLIYAHSGNQGFDPSQYKSFRADDDGIIPLLETDWGIRDDATNQLVEFIGVAWPKEHLQDNLKFIADSLGPNTGEQPRDTIRRYLATGFYKHHLSRYKKRPIYWLFSSGKQRAFQCLVYLHRYHEGTLARMRTEYVIPLQGQIAARIEQLEGDKAKATSTSHRRKLQKEQDDLKKQQAELATFEEKLKHAADQKISLDLDDGVKVNYAKFGDLLAESKTITGGKEEE
jgi:type II restriction/modification system DNA methylase subunit YeeA